MIAHNPRFRFFHAKLAAGLAAYGYAIEPDDLLELSAHLMSDDIASALTAKADWHVVWWQREAANTGDSFHIAPSRTEAVAAVLGHAAGEGDTLSEPEITDDEVQFYREDDSALYAYVRKVEFERPSDVNLRRVTTALKDIDEEDERKLLSRLAEFPGFKLQAYSQAVLGSNMDIPVGYPRGGEYLPSLAFHHGSKARNRYDGMTEVQRIEADHAAVVRNRHPMWGSPQAHARVLYSELKRLGVQAAKMSKCQDLIAGCYDSRSWNALVARFEMFCIPRVLVKSTADDEEAQVKFYRTPVEQLACLHDEGLRIKNEGLSIPYLGISWLNGQNMQVQVCDINFSDAAAMVVDALGPFPAQHPVMSEPWEAWRLKSAEVLQAANQWKSRNHFTATGYDEGDVAAAEKLLHR